MLSQRCTFQSKGSCLAHESCNLTSPRLLVSKTTLIFSQLLCVRQVLRIDNRRFSSHYFGGIQVSMTTPQKAPRFQPSTSCSKSLLCNRSSASARSPEYLLNELPLRKSNSSTSLYDMVMDKLGDHFNRSGKIGQHAAACGLFTSRRSRMDTT